ncbi:MAG: hypothetical protein KME30_29965 [Iphinoe sp. HA4291-MV1]|jgi:2-methylcitrate dehydratase PrpD|nr:hypothetical protein [Iphinoe sp. HA4291-MV1]
MKTEQQRQETIQAINELLNQAYDSTLDEILTLLERIETEEDENDLKAYHTAKNDPENQITIPWEDIKKEIANEKKTRRGVTLPLCYPKGKDFLH